MNLIWFKIEFGFENEMQKDLEIVKKIVFSIWPKGPPPLSAGLLSPPYPQLLPHVGRFLSLSLPLFLRAPGPASIPAA